MPARFDAVVVGAGAAGLFCAARAGQLGVRVLLLDHAEKVAEKIRISGGGRCNFTNLDTGPANFDSANPDFCRSALARYTPRDFIALVERHGIAWHEKHKGQLFCDDSSAQIVDMLLAECAAGGVERWQPCAVAAVSHGDGGFRLETARGPVEAARLVVATGGLSIPKIGASDWGYAAGAPVRPRASSRPGRRWCRWSARARRWQRFEALSGVALPVRIAADGPRRAPAFDEDLLFTHRGLSGPAALQISTFWRPGESAHGRPGARASTWARRCARPRRFPAARLGALLAELLPRRLAEAWLAADARAGRAPGRRPARPRPGAAGRRRCSAGRCCRPAARATARPRSRPAASTPGSSTRAAARAGACRACISSARWST